MKKSKDLNVPMPGEEPKDKKHGHGGPHGDKPKKKKRRHHTFLWIIVLVLLIGILIGLLIDRGIVFSGGEGWIGGLIGRDDGGTTKQPINLEGEITSAPTPVATQAVVETAAKVYLRVSGKTVYMNDVEVSADDILAQLQTTTYKNSKIIILDDDAVKSVFQNLKTVLENNGYSYTEGLE